LREIRLSQIFEDSFLPIGIALHRLDALHPEKFRRLHGGILVIWSPEIGQGMDNPHICDDFGSRHSPGIIGDSLEFLAIFVEELLVVLPIAAHRPCAAPQWGQQPTQVHPN